MMHFYFKTHTLGYTSHNYIHSDLGNHVPGRSRTKKNSSHIYFYFLSDFKDFPVGSVIKNPPFNAGDVVSISGGGPKTPHATGQPSLHAATTDRVLQDYRA